MTISILLDLDGTLIDSNAGIQSSLVAALRALGHAPDPNLDVKPFIGPPIEEGMAMLLQPFGDTRVQEAADLYRGFYGEKGYLESVAYPGISEALGAMVQEGWRLFLATSKREQFARAILQHLGLSGFFDGIYGAVPGGARDHKPALLAHIVATHALDPTRCVMVGDRRYDMIGAQSVGMQSLGVLWGYGAREELEQAGADLLIDEPDFMVRALATLLGAVEGTGE